MTGIPGRYPKVSFPIRRIEVCSGHAFERVVEEGTAVRCLRCGGTFTISASTAYLQKKSEDDMPYIRCPNCLYAAAVVNYYSQAAKRPERKKPYSSDVVIVQPAKVKEEEAENHEA